MVHSYSSSNSSELSERHALLILNALPSIGPITCKRLLSAFSGEARKVFPEKRKKKAKKKDLEPEKGKISDK